MIKTKKSFLHFLLFEKEQFDTKLFPNFDEKFALENNEHDDDEEHCKKKISFEDCTKEINSVFH